MTVWQRGAQTREIHDTGYSQAVQIRRRLTKERERELAELIQAGREAALGEITARARRTIAAGKRAENEYVEANLKLVFSVANRLAHSTPMELDDLIQEGNLGLMHAIEKFDWSKGTRFSTYAIQWIRHYIGRAITNQSRLVRLPADVDMEVRRVARSREKLSVTLGRTPSDEEVAADLKVDVQHVRRLDLYNQTPVSLSTDDGDMDVAVEDDTEGVRDNIPPCSSALDHLLDGLNAKERPVLELLYGIGDGPRLTHDEVAEHLRVSPRTVTRREYGGMKKLREMAA